MNIIIDSQILYNNYYLDTPRFKALFQYLKKTKSNLYILSLVYDETLKNYRKQVELYFKEVDKYERCTKAGLIEINKHTITSVVEDYKTKLNLIISRNKNIILYQIKETDLLLKSLIDRSLKDIRPFYSTGNQTDFGFRDSVILEGIKKIISQNKGDYCFISNDQKAFGSDNHLHDEINAEVNKICSSFHFFNTLDSFNSKYIEKINFINNKFILDYFNVKAKSDIESLISPYDIINAEIEDKNCDPTDIDKIAFQSLKIVDYYIYTSTDKYFYLYVKLIFELEGSFIDRLSSQAMGLDPFPDESYMNLIKSFQLKIDKDIKGIIGIRLAR